MTDDVVPHPARPRVCLLGPVTVRHGDREVPVAGPQQQALLALLALRLGQAVPPGQLVDELWPGGAPSTAATALRVHLARLRRALAPPGSDVDPLPRRPGGYLLDPSLVSTDVAEVEAWVARARKHHATGDDAAAVQLLDAALALPRGPLLPGLGDLPLVRQHADHVEELLLSAEEERVECRLALGHHGMLCGPAAELVAAAPFRERRTSLLMLALYRSGRQADALAAAAATRQLLVDELGIDPGPDLQALEGAMLRQEPGLSWTSGPYGAPAAGAGPGSPTDAVSAPVARGLRTLVAERFEALPPAARDVVCLLALLHEQGEPSVLTMATGLRGSEVAAALDLARDRGLVGEGDAAGWMRPDVAAALLACVPASEVARLHGAAADTLERLYGEAGLLRAARHRLAAASPDGQERPARTAARTAVLAADHSLRLGDARTAEALCHEALLALGAGLPAPERVDLLVRRARAQAQQDLTEQADTTWTEAVDLARALSDPQRFALAVLAHEWARRTMSSPGVDAGLLREALDLLGPAPSALRVRLLSALVGELGAAGELTAVGPLVGEVLDTAGAVGDTLAEVTAHHAQHLSLRASHLLEERRAAASALQRASTSLGDPYWRGVACAARLHDEFVAGTADGVADLLDDLAREAELAGSGRLLWHHLLARTSWLRVRGRYAEADRCAEQALVQGLAAGVPDAAAAALVHRFLSDLETSSVVPLVPLLQAHAQDRPVNVLVHVALAAAAAQAGEAEQARQSLDTVLSRLRSSVDERNLLATVLVAETELVLGQVPDLTWLLEALTPWSGQQVVFGQVTGTRGPVDLVLARLAAHAGDVGRARELLASAETGCREAGWVPWAQRCSEAWAGLSG